MHFFLFLILISFSSVSLQATIYLNPLDSVTELKYLPKIQPQVVIKACKKADRWPVIAWFRADSFCELFNCSLFAFKQKHPNSLTQEREDELFHLCIARDIVEAINYLHINSTQEKMLVLMEASSPQVLRLKINETFLTLMKSLLFVLNKRASSSNLASAYATQFMDCVMNLQNYQLAADFLVAVANDPQLLPEEERLCFLEKQFNSALLFSENFGLYAISQVLVKQACDKESSNTVRNIALNAYKKFLGEMNRRCERCLYNTITDDFMANLIQPFYAFSRSENTMRSSVFSVEERLLLTDFLKSSLEKIIKPKGNYVPLLAELHEPTNRECVNYWLNVVDSERLFVEKNEKEYKSLLRNGLKTIAAKKSKVRRTEWTADGSCAKKQKL